METDKKDGLIPLTEYEPILFLLRLPAARQTFLNNYD